MILADKHIFVVEDDASNLAIISAILRRHGGRVSYERWGRETARLMAQRGNIDIILLDLMFPGGVTGFDVFTAIRERPELAAVPVVAVTAADPAEKLRQAMDMGFSGFICKPIDRRTFPEQIAAVLAGKQVWLDEIVSNKTEFMHDDTRPDY